MSGRAGRGAKSDGSEVYTNAAARCETREIGVVMSGRGEAGGGWEVFRFFGPWSWFFGPAQRKALCSGIVPTGQAGLLDLGTGSRCSRLTEHGVYI